MNVQNVIDKLGLSVKAGEACLDRDVTGGYASDLLSDVMANAQKGDVWVTLQVHQNVIAVAQLVELAAVILIGDREPDSETVEKADAEGIPLLSTDMTTFETVVRLHETGISGRR